LNAALNSTIPAEAFRLRWNPFLLTVFPVTFPVAPQLISIPVLGVAVVATSFPRPVTVFPLTTPSDPLVTTIPAVAYPLIVLFFTVAVALVWTSKTRTGCRSGTAIPSRSTG